VKVLVAGAAGFIGSHLSRELLNQGHDVIGLDNFVTSTGHNIQDLVASTNFRFINCSVLDLDHGLEQEDLDLIFHLASPASPIKYQRHGLATLKANSDGTLNLINLALQTSSKFVFASTSEVYGDPLVSPQSEDYWGNVNPIGPRSVYDESKRLGETLVNLHAKEAALSATIVRIFNTYGPGMDPNDGRVVSSFVRQALTGVPLTIFGTGEQTRSFCFVSDLVKGLIAAGQSSEFGPFNLGNPKEITLIELANTVSRSLGVPLQIKYEALPQDDPQRRCPDISRARRILNWEPQVELHEGILLTADWMKTLEL
jgi:nucleoside-diphosphate-sugar epimerase